MTDVPKPVPALPPVAGLADDPAVGRWMERVRNSLHDMLPPGATVSADRIAQLVAHAHRAGIAPDDPVRIDVDARSISVQGHHPSHVARVDLTVPPPPAAQSLAVFDAAHPADPATGVQHAPQATGR